MELLQSQLACVGAESRRLAAAACGGPGGAAQQRGALLSSLRAAQLRAAAAGAAEAGRQLDAELLALSSKAAEWGSRAEGPDTATGGWLLCTADASAYGVRDAEAQDLISRWGVVRRLAERGREAGGGRLFPRAGGAASRPGILHGHARPSTEKLERRAAPGLLHNRRGMQLVNAAAGVAPPPGAEDSDDCEEDGPADAIGARRGDARRWRDQERRNEGLRTELSRQRAAFKAAYDAHMAAIAKRAAAEGALAAVEALLEAERRRGGAEGVEAVLQVR